jgi:transcriptional regulator GlxA family with amidase domain
MSGVYVIAAAGGLRHPRWMGGVVVVVFDGFQQLDATGPFEVLRAARQQVRLASPDGSAVRSSSGLVVGVDVALPDVRQGCEILLVAGGPAARSERPDARLVDEIGRLAPRARWVASVCTGAFLLAEAGLLDGRGVTTHWEWAELLASRYPALRVDADPVFIRDGDVWTSAGVTAGMDLALAMVEEDFGSDVARAIARHFVMYVQRPGGQAQFSAALRAQRAERNGLRELQDWLPDHLSEDLSIAVLARRASMSERHFARVFATQTGVTPGRYVERLRVEAAQRLLESTHCCVDDIATTCGFRTEETMRRSFVRVVRVAPSEYRRRFRKASA